MDFTATCRTCLKNSGLHPIFASREHHERFSSAIFLCTGIQIKLDDDLPQNICIECMNQVNNILKFRKQCKEAESQLYKIKSDITNSGNTKAKQSINITKNIPNLRNQFVTENCSNVMDMKDDSNINDYIKPEPSEIDLEEHLPLTVFVHNHTAINPLLPSNELKTNPIKTENNDTITENFINEEGSKRYTKEEKLLHDFNSTYGDVIDNELIPRIYSQTLQKPIDITEDSNGDNLDSLTSTLTETTVMETSSKHADVPYNILLTESTTKTARVICKICQKELSIRSIDTHMARRHPGADERKVKCELCDKYVMKEKMKRHKAMIHGSSEFGCRYCKSEFKTKELLVEHVPTCTAKKRHRKANDTGRTMAECDICHMKMQRASLKMHKAVKHGGLRPVCEHCGKSFGNKFRLNEHCRAKHGYEKFQCKYCEFQSAGTMAMRGDIMKRNCCSAIISLVPSTSSSQESQTDITHHDLPPTNENHSLNYTDPHNNSYSNLGSDDSNFDKDYVPSNLDSDSSRNTIPNSQSINVTIPEANDENQSQNLTKTGQIRKRKKYKKSLAQRREIKKLKDAESKYKLKPGCSTDVCKKQCHKHFTEEVRRNLNHDFRNMSWKEQQYFIINNTFKEEPKRRTSKIRKQARKISVSYFLTNETGTKINVCKPFFLETLGYLKTNDKSVRNALNTNDTPVDKRGINPNPNKIDNRNIIEHINSFNPSILHYERAPNKKYLPSRLTVTKMYQDFCEQKNMKELPVNEQISYCHYRKVVKMLKISISREIGR